MHAPNQQAPTTYHSVTVYRRIASLFLVLTVGVVGLVVYVVMARASIVVMSSQDTVEADFLLDVAREPDEDEIAGDVLEMSDTVSQTFPSASLAKADAHAEGRVKIASRLPRGQTLVATTRLLTSDNVLFRIKETVTVPSGGAVEVDAFADEAGVKGDVGMTTFIIPGLNPETRSFFTVTSLTPMQGGIKDVRMVTKSDVEEAGRVLRERIEADLAAKIRAKAGAFSGEFMTTETVSQTSDKPVGTEADSFLLTITAKTIAVFYDKTQFDKAIETHILEVVPYDRTLLRVEEGVMARTVEKIDVAAGRANVRVKAKGATILSTRSPSLDPSKLTGITVDAAETYLEKVEGVSSASVRVSPFWAGRTPNIAKNIKIEVR